MDVVSASLACFIFLAVRFSFNVRPGFFALTFCGDLPDMMAPSLVMADLASRRKPPGMPRASIPGSPGHVGLISAGCVHW